MGGKILRPLIGERLVLGHDLIDGDLRTIADGWLRAVTCEQIQFPFFIARMKKLMSVHFDHEAVLMRSSGGTLCECHRHEHRTLMDLCDQAAVQGVRNWSRAQSLLRNKFPKLFRNHIVGMDQFAVLFINTNMIVQTPQAE